MARSRVTERDIASAARFELDFEKTDAISGGIDVPTDVRFVSKKVETEQSKGSLRVDDCSLISAFGILVHRCTGEVNVLIAHNSGSNDSLAYEVDDFTDIFTAMPQLTFEAAYKRVQSIIDAQLVPGTSLPAASRQALPHMLITRTELPDDSSSAAGAVVVPTESISLHISVVQGHVHTSTLYFNAHLFETGCMSALLDAWSELLSSISLYPSAKPLGKLPLLSVRHRTMVLTAYNQTGVEFPNPDTECLHHLFEAQADRFRSKFSTQSHPAVVLPGASRNVDTQLSYGALEALANQWGRYLMERAGAKRGDLIAILLNRSPGK